MIRFDSRERQRKLSFFEQLTNCRLIDYRKKETLIDLIYLSIGDIGINLFAQIFQKATDDTFINPIKLI